MMKIYYSIYDALKSISKYRFGDKPNQSTGWGKFIQGTFQYLQDYGYKMVDSIEEADIELFLGQPPLKIFPSMSPNIIFTMYEASKLPDSWVNALNNWDLIINPSDWGCKCFEARGVSTKISKIPLWIDPYFEYKERDINSQRTYLSMGVQLTDRKNQMMVVNLFKDGKMPNDTKLLVKTTPVDRNNLDWHFVFDNVHLIQKDMEIEELRNLVYDSHISVNPSGGEGFGNIPCLLPGTLVYSDNSTKPIEDIEIGDLVLTHKGSWKKVIDKSCKQCDNNVLEIKAFGSFRTINITKEHIVPIYRPGRHSNIYELFSSQQYQLFNNNILWVRASEMRTSDLLLQPIKIDNLDCCPSVIDLANHIEQFECDDEFIWLKSSYSTSPKYSYKDLVKVTGFSNRTLQRVIQNQGDISEELKNKVEEKLGELNYQKPKPIKIRRFWELDEQFAYVLGLYTAEGSHHKGVCEFSLHEDEVEYAKAAIDFLNSKGKIACCNFVVNGTKGRRVCFSSTLVGRFFSTITGSGAANKRVPKFIMNSLPSIKHSYIKGLFDGDAHISTVEKRYVSLCTISQELAFQIKLLVQSIGLFATITRMEHKEQNFNTAYFVNIGGKQLIGSEFLQKNWDNSFARQFFFQDTEYYYLRVQNIKEVQYSGLVYDIKVEDDETFCIEGGYIVHNCEHMLAGCCTILSDYSALKELCNVEYNLPLKCKEIPSPYRKLFGTIGEPNEEHLLELMLWTYEHKEEALKLGELSSQWIKRDYSIERFCNRLNDILDLLVNSTPKKIFNLNTQKENYMRETFQ